MGEEKHAWLSNNTLDRMKPLYEEKYEGDLHI
jgi:hypothetical protein